MRNLTLLLALAIAGCNGDSDSPSQTGDTGATATGTIEDVFTQNLLEEVDIVVVFDPNWDDASTAFKTTMESVGYKSLLMVGANWQMGSMTSDLSNVNHRGFIGGVHSTVFPSEDTLDPPRTGGQSRVREAIYIALTDQLREGGANEEFFRPDAHTYFLVITQSRDRSEEEPISEDAFIDFLGRAEFTQSIRMGVITLPNKNTQRYWTGLTDPLDGAVGSVGSWDRVVESQLFEAMDYRREFELSRLPTTPPREITVIERDRPRTAVIEEDFDFIAARNTIRFIGDIPRPGSQIRVTYNAGAPVEEPPAEPTN